jgi:hypothetical protein
MIPLTAILLGSVRPVSDEVFVQLDLALLRNEIHSKWEWMQKVLRNRGDRALYQREQPASANTIHSIGEWGGLCGQI